MASKKVVKATMALLSSSLNLEISDATVDAWELILMETYDQDLPKATVEVLKSWVTTFLPPPGLVLAECRKQCHQRMLKLDYDRRLSS